MVYFSFEDNCKELEIKFSTRDFETEAEIEFLLNQKVCCQYFNTISSINFKGTSLADFT